MAELDKIKQKTQIDLVQSVIEAHERRNTDRVDMLVTNAIKQLKMSRFKPDQSTCISLTYIAKISPKVFSQSGAIKDTLKSLLRRDNGPTNIKGKNDILLPVLCANILLACCDETSVRTLILSKIDQWLGSSAQKPSDLVQHLLGTICSKCHGDSETIGMLVDMRQNWLQFLEENTDTYGFAPVDLCSRIRQLLDHETSCESIVNYLKFLIKHDLKISQLASHVSEFVLHRSLTLVSLLEQDEKFGLELYKMLLKIYIKLIDELKVNPQIKPEKDDSTPAVAYVYLGLPCSPAKTPNMIIQTNAIEAILSLLSSVDDNFIEAADDECRADYKSLLSCLIIQAPKQEDPTNGLNSNLAMASICEDAAMSQPYELSDKLRTRLILSNQDSLIEFCINKSTNGQLVRSLQLFGSSQATIELILDKIKAIKNLDALRAEIQNESLFTLMMDYYSESMQISSAKELAKRLDLVMTSS